MYNTHRSLYDRSLEKTPEQVFINSLRREFELSPAESCGVLELAKRCLFGEVPHTLGKLRYLCASVKAKHEPDDSQRHCRADSRRQHDSHPWLRLGHWPECFAQDAYCRLVPGGHDL